MTFYTNDDELPKLGNMDLYAGNGTTYRYYSGKPEVPFGFGKWKTKPTSKTKQPERGKRRVQGVFLISLRRRSLNPACRRPPQGCGVALRMETQTELGSAAA